MSELLLNRVSRETTDEATILAAAHLVYQAAPHFYDLIPLERSDVIRAIAHQIDEPGTELSSTYINIRNGVLRAIVCLVDASTLPKAKSAGLSRFLRLVPNPRKPGFVRSLADYSSSVAPLTDRGIYIPRIAVTKCTRGQGLGEAMVKAVKATAPQEALLLHVRQDNLAATRLYKKLGFRQLSADNFTYQTWKLD